MLIAHGTISIQYSRDGLWLTTLTGDTVGLHDLVAYYVDTKETMPGFSAVGKNVMVLKEYEVKFFINFIMVDV